MQVHKVHGVPKSSNVNHVGVRALQICRQRMCLCSLFSSAYIIQFSPQHISSYIHINMYMYDEISAPSVRASGAHGGKPLI